MAEEPATREDPTICEGDILCERYRADRVIEHGETGTVLAVTDLVRNERAAIKMISADHGEGPLLLARLRREADILARLTSPHVVRVLDVAMHGRTLCLVMELLAGHNMARFVRKRGPLPIKEAVGYLVQACDGLADAHSAGVVHRDVKPQNVFLGARSDGTSIVKVRPGDLCPGRRAGVAAVVAAHPARGRSGGEYTSFFDPSGPVVYG